MKPDTLSEALRLWRLAYLTGELPAAVVVDGSTVLTLETTLLLAADNLGKAARYDALVAYLRFRLGDAAGMEWVDKSEQPAMQELIARKNSKAGDLLDNVSGPACAEG